LAVDLTAAADDKDKMAAGKQAAANSFVQDPRFRSLKAVATGQSIR